MRRRLLSVLLALSMLLALLPVQALAEEENVQKIPPLAVEDTEVETPEEESLTGGETEPVLEPQPSGDSTEESQSSEAPTEALAENAESSAALYAGTVAYPVTGGNLYFDPATGNITDCDTSVTSADIPSEIGGMRVTSIGTKAFYYCTRLTTVTLPNSVTSIGMEAFSGCSSLISVTIPNSITNIDISTFENCSHLTSVTIPHSVISIMRSAFSGCSSLTNVTIPHSVTSIGSKAFAGCRSLMSITIPDSVKIINAGTFRSCNSLTSIIIPNSITQIDGYAFSGCRNLTNVTIPNSITSIEGFTFEGCNSLTNITIPNSVTSIGSYAFSSCRSLSNVVIPNNVNTILEGAFECCSSMTNVTIPNSITFIGEGTFAGCSGLTSVTIPNSVTSIQARAFFRCSSLTSITIPDSVTRIANYAFSECESLTDVYYSGSNAEWHTVLIESNNGSLVNATIHFSNTVSSSPSSVYSKQADSFTLTISENKKAPRSPADQYQLSASAEIACNGSTGQTKKDGAYQIRALSASAEISVSKTGFAPVALTAAQLKEHPEIYLEPVRDGYPTVAAVWLDGVDIRHFESEQDLLSTDPVTITADVAWDSAKGAGTVKLVQGAKSVTLSDSAPSAAVVLKNYFDISKTVYIWAGYDDTYKTMKPLKLKAATVVPDKLNGFKFDLGDKLNFTLPDEIPFLGGTKMGVGLYSSVPVTIEIEDEKIYVAIGLQKDGEYNKNTGWTAKSFSKSVRDLQNTLKSAESALNQYKRVQDAMNAFGGNLAIGKGSLGIDAGVSVMGFAEGYLDNSGTPHWLGSGVVVSISGGVDYSFPFYLGPVPLFFETELSAEATGQLNLLIQEAAKSFTPNGVIEGSITLSGGLGVGIKKVASLSGGLEGELKDHWEPSTNYNQLTAKLKAFAKVGILLYSGSKKWDLAEKTWELPSRASLQSPEEGPYAALYDDLYDPGFYSLLSTEELTDRSTFLAGGTASLFSAEDGGTREIPFAADVYAQAKPQLASFSDGTLLAVWTGLDNSRAVYDRPRLYYALCEGGTWSAPAPVDADGSTMEGEPSLEVADDTAYLAWCRANGPVGTPADLTEAAAKLDIWGGVFDRANGQWTVSRLTDDQTADFSPAVSGGNSGAAVVWQNNSANDLFGKNGTTSLLCSQYGDGTWTSPSSQYNSVGEISNLDSDLSGSTLRVAWTRTEADGGSAVYLDGTRQGAGSGAAFHNGSLYWYQDGRLYQDGQDTGAALDSDRFQLMDNTLLYISGSGLRSTLTAHYYDASSGRWSDAVALTDGQQSIGSFSAASAGTALQVLLASTEVNKELADIQSDSDDPYGNTNLVLLADVPFCDLSLGEPWYLEDTYVPGSSMEFHLKVTNNGNVPTNYMVSVSDTNGAAYNTVSQQRLLPGCTEETTVVYEQEETLSSQLTFTVKALEGTDADPSNDQSALSLQYEDVSVENIGNGVTEDGQYLVYADIVNRGYGEQSGITVSLYQDAVSGSPLQTVTLDSINSMCSQPVSFQVPAPAEQACYVITASGSGIDMNAATDSGFTVCAPQENVQVVLSSMDGQQVELLLDGVPAGTLVVAAYDGSGKMVAVGLASLTGGEAEAHVTMQGTVTAGDSLKAYVLDASTRAPLMGSVNLLGL